MLSIADHGPPPPCPAPFNLADYVLSAGRATLDKVALVVMGLTGAERWSFARLEAAVRGVASGMLENGARPGDRVLLRLGNQVEFPLAFLGAAAAGLVPVVTSAQWTAREVTRAAQETEPSLIVAAPGLALPEIGGVVLGLEELRGWFDRASHDFAETAPDTPGYIVYTSGTSGRPRAVLHAHRAVWARRMMREGWTAMEPGDRVMHAGAFNWTYTLGTGLLDPWACGATALVPGEGVTPEALSLLMKRHDATIFAAVPGIYRRLLRQAIPPLPRLRHALSAGEKLSPAIAEAWQAATGRPIFEAFGMSECSTFLSGSPARPAPDGSLGFAQPGRRVAVVDPDGRPVGQGETGIIAVDHGDPGLALGYLGDREEWQARLAGGWFLTGDLGEMAEEGAIAYRGRADDMMNAGGARVSPVEVESAIAAHPAISECAACEITVASDTTVIACAYVADGEVTEDDLAAFAQSRLARYKQPRLWRRVDALPRNANGKLARRSLRAAWESDLGQA